MREVGGRVFLYTLKHAHKSEVLGPTSQSPSWHCLFTLTDVETSPGRGVRCCQERLGEVRCFIFCMQTSLLFREPEWV